MPKESLKNRSTRFYKLLLTYLLLLATAVAIMYPMIMGRYVDSIDARQWEGCISRLNNAAAEIDTHMNELSATANHISSSYTLNPKSVAESSAQRAAAITELNGLLQTNRFISRAFLFYPGLDTVLTNEYKYEYSSFFDFIHPAEWGMDFVTSALNNRLFGRILPVSDLNEVKDVVNSVYSSVGQYLHVFYTLPVNSSRPHTILCLLVNSVQLDKLCEGALGGFDGRLEILIGDMLLYRYTRGDGINDAVTHLCTAPVSGITLKIQLDADEFRGEIDSAKRLIWFSFVVLTVIGVVLAYVFSYWHYKPLRAIASKLDTCEKDEIKALSTGIDNLITNNYIMSESLRDTHVSGLLEGSYDTQSAYSELGFDACGVILFKIDDVPAFHSALDARARELILKSVCDILVSCAGEFSRGYAIIMPGGSMCALVTETADSHMLCDIANAAYEMYREYHCYGATFGVSRASESLTDAHQHYLEAMAALKQSLSSGGGCVYSYEELPVSADTSEIYSKATEAELASLVRAGKLEHVYEFINDIMSKLRSKPLAAEAGALLALNITNTLITLQKELGSPTKPQQVEMLNLIQSGQATSESLGGLLTELTESLARDFARKKVTTKQNRVQDMLDLISKRYRSNTFSLQEVADALELSPSYVTQLFQDEIGQPLMHYVDTMRMSDAVTLLETTKMPVKDIVALVGYTDQTNFIRKFKQLKGETPAAYRRAREKNDE